MRVLLDTTYSRRAPYSGTAVYLDRLQDALARLEGVEVIARANLRRRRPAGGGPGSVSNLLSDRWWTDVELPRLARRLNVDLIHHPLPAISRARWPPPQVVTVHDLAFERLPRQFDRRFRLYAHFAHRAAARRAGAVVCVSESTAADVRTLWGIPDERIVVARHGPGQRLPPSPGRRVRHFLYVGDCEPRKNVGTLLAAYRRYRQADPNPLELVLAGSAGVLRAADASAVGEGLRVEGLRVEANPAPARLSELYAGAAALVHPSLHEGFGLTVLEAMRAGVPVIASRVPAVEELGGDAIRYADPLDPSAFALQMVEIAARPALRAELWQRGRRRAARFSWEASARSHLRAYSLALGA